MSAGAAGANANREVWQQQVLRITRRTPPQDSAEKQQAVDVTRLRVYIVRKSSDDTL
jgi:hypothetical protein